MANCTVSTKAFYFLAGASIGALIALLFAPSSGEETRKAIAGKAGEGRDYVASKGRELRKQAGELVEKGKEAVGKQKERLGEVIEAGKQAARSTFVRE